MKRLIEFLFGYRIRALIKKEFAQIGRDQRMRMSLILPPVIQLLLFSYVLNATVSNLKLGIIDDSRTPESRALTSTLTESKSFRLAGYYDSVQKMGDAISQGDLAAGVVIPKSYAEDLQRGRPVTVQFLMNAMNTNIATIGQAYALGVLQTYNSSLAAEGIHARFVQAAAPDVSRRGVAVMHTAFLYNPGLQGTWFVVTGIFGMLILLNGSMVSATAMVKERERGTIEQLLMCPAGTYEIIVAKIAPLFILLFGMVMIAMAIIKFVFDVPFHGSIWVLLAGEAMCILSGIGIGTVVATFSSSAFQAMLTSFFVNPLLTTASGATTPAEAIPNWLQPLVKINPIRHFSIIARSSMIKGTGFEVLWPNFLVLAIFTVIMVSASVWRFRKQLS